MNLPYIRIQKTFPQDGNTIVDVAQVDLPEEYMDKYEKIRGDGAAKVTVGADMALKEYGSGAGAFVSVTLSCGQTQETIEEAIDLAGSIARTYCVEQHKQAEKEFMASKNAQAQLGAGGYGQS